MSTTPPFIDTQPLYQALQDEIRTVRINGVSYPYPGAARFGYDSFGRVARTIAYECSRYIAGYRDAITDCIRSVENIQKLYDQNSPEWHALRRVIGFCNFMTEETRDMADPDLA